MDRDHVESVAVKYLREVLPELAGEDVAAGSFEALGVDSMSAIDLMMHLEKEFGVEIPDDDLVEIQRIADVVDYVVGHGSAGDSR